MPSIKVNNNDDSFLSLELKNVPSVKTYETYESRIKINGFTDDMLNDIGLADKIQINLTPYYDKESDAIMVPSFSSNHICRIAIPRDVIMECIRGNVETEE